MPVSSNGSRQRAPAHRMGAHLSRCHEMRGACLQASEARASGGSADMRSPCASGSSSGRVCNHTAASHSAALRLTPCGVAGQTMLERQLSCQQGACMGAREVMTGGGYNEARATGDPMHTCGPVMTVTRTCNLPRTMPARPPATSASVRLINVWVAAAAPNPMRRSRCSSAVQHRAGRQRAGGQEVTSLRKGEPPRTTAQPPWQRRTSEITAAYTTSAVIPAPPLPKVHKHHPPTHPPREPPRNASTYSALCTRHSSSREGSASGVCTWRTTERRARCWAAAAWGGRVVPGGWAGKQADTPYVVHAGRAAHEPQLAAC